MLKGPESIFLIVQCLQKKSVGSLAESLGCPSLTISLRRASRLSFLTFRPLAPYQLPLILISKPLPNLHPPNRPQLMMVFQKNT